MPASVALYYMYCTLLTVTDGSRRHKGQGCRGLNTTCSGATRPPFFTARQPDFTRFTGMLNAPGLFPRRGRTDLRGQTMCAVSSMYYFTRFTRMLNAPGLFPRRGRTDLRGQTMCAVSSIYSTAQPPTRPNAHAPTRPKVHKDRLRSRAKASAAGSPPSPPPPLA